VLNKLHIKNNKYIKKFAELKIKSVVLSNINTIKCEKSEKGLVIFITKLRRFVCSSLFGSQDLPIKMSYSPKWMVLPIQEFNTAPCTITGDFAVGSLQWSGLRAESRTITCSAWLVTRGRRCTSPSAASCCIRSSGAPPEVPVLGRMSPS
jgi:hypothetical protein